MDGRGLKVILTQHLVSTKTILTLGFHENNPNLGFHENNPNPWFRSSFDLPSPVSLHGRGRGVKAAEEGEDISHRLVVGGKAVSEDDTRSTNRITVEPLHSKLDWRVAFNVDFG